MNPKQMTHRQTMVWLAAAAAAPLVKTASGCSWPVVLVVGSVTLFLSWWLTKYTAELKAWLVILQGLWASAVISEMLWWIGDCWPGHNSVKAAPLILLTLAAWAASGGKERTARIGCVLVWPIGFLLGAVLLSSSPEVRLENLLPSWQMRDAGLIPVLLFLALYGRREAETTCGVYIGLLSLAVLTAAVTAGVLSPGVSGSTELAVYELARSIPILGVGGRFESMIAVGMTMGYWAAIGYLLSIPKEIENRSRMIWAYAALSGVMFAMDLRIDSRVLAIGSILFWVVLPALCGVKNIFQKPPKTA